MRVGRVQCQHAPIVVNQCGTREALSWPETVPADTAADVQSRSLGVDCRSCRLEDKERLSEERKEEG